jgi:hypothetical protein
MNSQNLIAIALSSFLFLPAYAGDQNFTADPVIINVPFGDFLERARQVRPSADRYLNDTYFNPASPGYSSPPPGPRNINLRLKCQMHRDDDKKSLKSFVVLVSTNSSSGSLQFAGQSAKKVDVSWSGSQVTFGESKSSPDSYLSDYDTIDLNTGVVSGILEINLRGSIGRFPRSGSCAYY